MSWETPTFKEIRMDAEVSSYQEDNGDQLPWPLAAASGEQPR
jgi:hypothetical protein